MSEISLQHVPVIKIKITKITNEVFYIGHTGLLTAC